MKQSVSKPWRVREKANLGDFPVSKQAAEAKDIFTWFTTTQRGNEPGTDQGQFQHQCVFMCMMYIEGPDWRKCKHSGVKTGKQTPGEVVQFTLMYATKSHGLPALWRKGGRVCRNSVCTRICSVLKKDGVALCSDGQ